MPKKRKVEKSINKIKEIGFQNEVLQDIYTVFGEAGEYSDKEVWPVCSHENEELANEHVEKANEYVQQYKKKHSSDRWTLRVCTVPYDIDIKRDARSLNYYTYATKITRVIKWPFLRTIFIAYYRGVDSPFYKEKLPIGIFKLICKYVVEEYRF